MPIETLPVRDWTSEEEIAAVLRGEPRPPLNPASFVNMAICHRMAPLLVSAGAAKLLPSGQAERLVEEARAWTVKNALRDRELRRVLSALAAEGLEVLLMKGAHLAHSHYRSPHLRPCDDADLLVRRGDLDRIGVVLAREGYRRQHHFTGDTVLGQVLFGRDTMPGALLDVHWRIAAPRLAADLLQFDELTARAVDLPGLGAAARALSPVDALAVACVHQAAHHPGHDLMLWMYDVHLLVASLTDGQIDEFVARAVDRRMANLCVYSLDDSVRRFPNPATSRVLRQLQAAPHDEPTAILINPRRPVSDLLLDLSAIRGWRERIQLVLGHLFPPPAYMRKAFAASSPAILPWLYVYRIARGAGRWFRVK